MLRIPSRTFAVLSSSLTVLVFSAITLSPAFSEDQPHSPAATAPPGGVSPQTSADSGETGCAGIVTPLKPEDVVALLESKAHDDVIMSDLKTRSHLTFSPADLAKFANTKRPDGTSSADTIKELLQELARGPEVYIGWSVLPSRVVRDNYGHYVMDKYFGLDVAIASRSQDSTKSILITALEFCHRMPYLKDISADPTLVRGSLQKGELTGEREIISSSIQ